MSAVLAALLLAASVRGTVTITGKKSEALDPSRAVVWLEGHAAPPAIPAKGVMTTHGKKFTPEVLVLPAGSEVAFPNEDSIQHNAFSSSEGNRFDVGLYGTGPGKEVVMRAPGIVRVYCNVHPQMAAFVIVTPSALAARVKPDGTFEITGVPAGSYELKAWDERGGTSSVPVEVKTESAPDVSVTLDGSRFKQRPHLDKDGKSYEERGTPDYP
ncbi:MAG TPA: hypothetical protein VJ826_00095 [Candidatus Polarisedimenticolaceae bacterium]|nr:hypothetical protein [Candidatus Polarisedimenticolaceae bacterium]